MKGHSQNKLLAIISIALKEVLDQDVDKVSVLKFLQKILFYIEKQDDK